MVARIKNLLIVLIVALSFTCNVGVYEAHASALSVNASASSAGVVTWTVNKSSANASIVKKGNDLYYNDPKNGGIRRKAGFITYQGSRYYIQSGGNIVYGRTFKVGSKQYRAWSNGKIAVGAYRWYDGKCYFSDAKTGEWIKKEQFIWWKGNRYYIQPNTTLAANKGFIIKYRYPYYADGYCRVTAVPVENKNNTGVLKVAQKEVGTMTGYKYWSWYFGTRFIDTDRTPWCACFTAWCYNQAGQYNRISAVKRYGNLGYVPSYSRFASNYGKWINRKYARGGDLIVFGQNQGSHIGIVEKVYNGYVYTIEGNSGPTAAYGSRKPGAVTRKVYKLNDKYIKGVIRAL